MLRVQKYMSSRFSGYIGCHANGFLFLGIRACREIWRGEVRKRFSAEQKSRDHKIHSVCTEDLATLARQIHRCLWICQLHKCQLINITDGSKLLYLLRKVLTHLLDGSDGV